MCYNDTMETLALFLALLDAYGDATVGLGCGGDMAGCPPRFRVTRRGNLYDEAERCTVWHTHGLGSIRQRRALAAWLGGVLNATAAAPRPPAPGPR